jgi:hypothetical protein
MNDPSLALQKGVFTALSAALAGVAGVYDRVPLDNAGAVTAPFPYAHIGEDHILAATDQCHDAFDAFAVVHVWSRAVGKVEAKTVMGLAIAALAANLVLDGFAIITWACTDGPRHMTDLDGLTSHSVVTFRYRLAPV